MAGMGAGYDLSVSTFSPDGRVFQVEYASKAVDNSITAMAFSCKDGLVLAVQKMVTNPMVLHHKTNRRIYALSKHVAVAVSGFIADGRQLVERARSECESYEKFFSEPIPVRVLAERMGLYVHAYTLYWSVRPFGASLLICGVDKDQKLSLETKEGSVCGEIYCIEPSGTCYKYLGQSIGKGRQNVKTELEKVDLSSLRCREALVLAAKVLHAGNDDGKPMDVELGCISEKTGFLYMSVGEDETGKISEEAKNILARIDEETAR